MSYKLILKNIRHIFELRMNLIFTGVIDDEGFSSHFTQGVWKLIKCPLIITKEKKCCSLYKINDTIF